MVLLEAGLPVVGIDGVADLGAIETLTLDAVAATGSADDLTPIRRALAARNGPILPLISDRISPASYASERALCIDTTAAGGNTALLARVGNEDVS
jgi:RHH-type proline utilization regulon transcriptional repressor/proline dehydrogenase/delta 1-pyrroline-5-carboxylate dehydrogenase